MGAVLYEVVRKEPEGSKEVNYVTKCFKSVILDKKRHSNIKNKFRKKLMHMG